MSTVELETVLTEFRNSLDVIKWVYPLIVFAFSCVVGLLIYIWKSHTTRTDELMKMALENLNELRTIAAVHETEIKNLKGAVFHGEKTN